MPLKVSCAGCSSVLYDGEFGNLLDKLDAARKLGYVTAYYEDGQYHLKCGKCGHELDLDGIASKTSITKADS